MQTLLRIDSSSRIKGSHSRELGDCFERLWLKANNDGQVIYRDLASSNLPHIHDDTIKGFYTPVEHMDDRTKEATACSDQLISELKLADELLITSPLYNFNVPSNLKAYFDQVTRVGHTFEVANGHYQGLLSDKTAYVILAKGGNYLGTDLEFLDFQGPYLKAILGHIGIAVKETFNLEGTADQSILSKNKAKITQAINSIFND